MPSNLAIDTDVLSAGCRRPTVRRSFPTLDCTTTHMVASNLSPAEAVAHTYMNRAEIERSDVCGCYSCLRLFPSLEIKLWTDSTDEDDEQPGAIRPSDSKYRGFTAVCPYCEESSVIGSASGVQLNAKALEAVLAYVKGR